MATADWGFGFTGGGGGGGGGVTVPVPDHEMTAPIFIDVGDSAEEWRRVEGYEVEAGPKRVARRYEVSSAGRVRSVSTLKSGRVVVRDKKSVVNGRGYVQTKIAGKTVWAHRLVAAAFCERRVDCGFVDHINGVKDDNRAENIRWVSRGENRMNVVHGVDFGVRRCGTKWRAQLRVDGEMRFLGRFLTKEEARARVAAVHAERVAAMDPDGRPMRD